jgi:predicted DNA-binding transcriptional regulator YafY
MTADPRICAAISSKRVIGFEYPDEDGNYHHRTVEPYAHGTKQADEVVFGYQIAGTSETLETLPGWRTFVVGRMRNLTILERAFAGDAPGRDHTERHLDRMHCMVQG